MSPTILTRPSYLICCNLSVSGNTLPNLRKFTLDALVWRYNCTLSNIIDGHALLNTRTVKVNPAVPWYNDEKKAAKRLRRKAEKTWRRTKSLSDLNIFKSHRNRVIYLMKEARPPFYTNFIDENSVDHKRLVTAIKKPFAKKEDLSFPNYHDKSKLANNIGRFFSLR